MLHYEVRILAFPESKVTKTPGWVIRLLRESVSTTKHVDAENREQCILQILQEHDRSATVKQIVEDEVNASDFDHAHLKKCKWVAFVDKQRQNAILSEIHFADAGWVWSVPQYTFTPRNLIEVELVEEKAEQKDLKEDVYREDPLADGLPKARILHQKYPKLIPQEEAKDNLQIDEADDILTIDGPIAPAVDDDVLYLQEAISFFEQTKEQETKCDPLDSLVCDLKALRLGFPLLQNADSAAEWNILCFHAVQSAKACTTWVSQFDAITTTTNKFQDWLENMEAVTCGPIEV